MEWLAVESDFRHRNIGSLLLQELEKRCRQMNIHTIVLNTQDYQAPVFYEKNGFNLAGQIRDFPFEGTIRYFLSKRL
ncbi:GNAT family N-acetyltransferase [Ileibacterium valens]|uniref:N-acetyltransferase domain-containing protein n=1 Tax=Ileibacterium valens TaxID=1862668 RepID=A0A1U7NIQ8_9FIRM|nr:GNAT family N-acetyltransferase [Ileibacterium valens]OLU36103.1 hypothetical protein BO224_12960 [Erysipelotrichaceae bacterium NYU-BL-E8]OLU41784.1 hypothetical protein BM735_03595 [Erysipelotrichaceae bacterium NYU-BL-F16]OLU42535.1 hypothetical protein BO222_01445 [Ileibacterium valens]